MKKSFAAVCGGLLIVALAAGCETTQAPSAARSPARSAASSPSVSRPASRAPATAASAGVTQPSGGPVPAGFRAASVTFVSAREAFVLGTAPCQHAPCTSIARTLDRGVSWRGLPAPVVPLGEPYTSTGPVVWGIRFATPEHGFVFGNGLWVSTDGGEQWSAVAYPGGAVLSLEIVDHQVLAVTARHGLNGLTGWTLSRRALGGGPWIGITALAYDSGAGGIATQAGVAAVVDGSSVLVTSNGGLTVTKHATPCPAAGSPFPVVTSVAAQAPHGLALLCTGQGYTGHTDKTVYVSGDLGATWKLAGHPASAGDGGMIAASAPGQLTIASTSAASWLYYSADNGKTWRTVVTYLDGGQGWNDLGFTTTGDGVIIHGHPAYGDMLGQLLLTDNGGLTWHAITS
jgi:BNR/Asp-box repeat protein